PWKMSAAASSLFTLKARRSVARLPRFPGGGEDLRLIHEVAVAWLPPEQPHRLTRVHVLVQCQRVGEVPHGPARLGEGRRPQLTRLARRARRRGRTLVPGCVRP